MDAGDQLLDQIVREWAASQRASVSALPGSAGGPPGIAVKPANPASAPMRLWVADDGKHVALSIGGGSWWERAALLDKQSIVELLSAVATGHAKEEIRKIGGHIVGRRGQVQLPAGKVLQYGQLFGIPGLKWHQVAYEPY
jgi:hypothetical protein